VERDFNRHWATTVMELGLDRLRFLELSCAWVTLGAAPVPGQWITQTIDLNPGWNAINLEVQPEPRDCDAVFGGLQIESVRT